MVSATSDCVFCGIVDGRNPSSVVYQDKSVIAFLDIQPVTPGHTLVIPRSHAASLAELAARDGERMFAAGQLCAAALRKSSVKCEGVNMSLADGEVAGQEVFHVHLHVFPRFSGDGFGLKFGPDYRKTLPSRSELDRIASLLRVNVPSA